MPPAARPRLRSAPPKRIWFCQSDAGDTADTYRPASKQNRPIQEGNLAGPSIIAGNTCAGYFTCPAKATCVSRQSRFLSAHAGNKQFPWPRADKAQMRWPKKWSGCQHRSTGKPITAHQQLSGSTSLMFPMSGQSVQIGAARIRVVKASQDGRRCDLCAICIRN